MSADLPGGRATILVCVTCRAGADPDDAPRAGAALAEATAIAAAAAGVPMRRVSCLANCKRGLSAAIRCDGAWSYVFGDLQAARDADALVAGARLLAQAADGLMPWRGRPESLKRGLIARIPPAGYVEEPS